MKVFNHLQVLPQQMKAIEKMTVDRFHLARSKVAEDTRRNAVLPDYLGSGRSDGSEDSLSSFPNGLK